MIKVVITGGIGSGKSEAIRILRDNYNCKVVSADDVARLLMKPGSDCYDRIIDAFPGVNLTNSEDETLDKAKLSHLIYSDDEARRKVNSIVHPAVKEYIMSDVASEESLGLYEYYFLECALAIEEGYDKLFDWTWCIYAPLPVRWRRLRLSRGLSDKRIGEIIKAQLTDDDICAHATHIIDNSSDYEALLHNIQSAIEY